MIYLLIIHIALCLVGLCLCKAAKESEWVVFCGLCLLPFIGPIYVIFSYIYLKVKEQARESYREQELNK